MSDLDFEMQTSSTEEAEQELSTSGGPGRTSQYEPIADKYVELDEGQAIVLSGMSKNDIQNLRNLLYRRFGKENVIVRSSQQDDDTYKAVVRDREGNEYLRDQDSTNGTVEGSGDEEPTEAAEKADEGEAVEGDDLF